MKENLWLCLTCASLGCGRQQFGGLGGNGHGLKHYETTKHPVSVKLGTITPEGAGTLFSSCRWFSSQFPVIRCLDVYCYACNDSKEDPGIASHLSNFGINVQSLTKTEKNMTELASKFSYVIYVTLIIFYPSKSSKI